MALPKPVFAAAPNPVKEALPKPVLELLAPKPVLLVVALPNPPLDCAGWPKRLLEVLFEPKPVDALFVVVDPKPPPNALFAAAPPPPNKLLPVLFAGVPNPVAGFAPNADDWLVFAPNPGMQCE